MENILNKISKQCEKEIYDELTPKDKYYQLSIFDKIFSEDFKRITYPVPDLKSALVVIDAICLIMKHRDLHDLYFTIQYKNNINDEWEDWEDDLGNTLNNYEIDENFSLYLPSEYDE